MTRVQLCLILFVFSLQANAQHTNAKSVADSVDYYFSAANRLSLQTNKDSINKAYRLHSRVLELNKNFIPSYNSKICIDYIRGHLKTARETANAYIKNCPDAPTSWVYLGVVETKMKDSVAAALCFRKAYDLFGISISQLHDNNAKMGYQAEQSIVGNWIGIAAPAISGGQHYANGSTTSYSASFNNTGNVKDFTEHFMSYNGLQLF